MANAMISFRKTLVISGLLGLMSHAVVLAQTSTPQIVDKTTACIDLPTKKNCQGIGTTFYPWFDDYPELGNEETSTIPESMITVLLTLPTTEVVLPLGLRQEFLSEKTHVRVIPGYGAQPDYILYQPEYSDLLQYGIRFWMRSFEGKDPADTVYLVGINSSCVLIDDYYQRHPEDTEPRAPCSTYIPKRSYSQDFEEYGNPSHQEEWGWTRKSHSEDARIYRLRAYRLDAKGIPQDVTKEVLPSLSTLALPEKDLYQYWQGGFTGVVLDDYMLTKVPVFRWVAALYPGAYDLPNDPRLIFQHKIFFSYVIWNGKTFESHRWIKRNLWPCGESSRDDGFIYDPKIEVITQAKDGYVNLRAKPSTQSKILKKIPNDIRLHRKDTEGDWIYVYYFEGDNVDIGYVHQSQVLYE